eukprot:21566-Heterococcus_DN1.PRE.2
MFDCRTTTIVLQRRQNDIECNKPYMLTACCTACESEAVLDICSCSKHWHSTALQLATAAPLLVLEHSVLSVCAVAVQHFSNHQLYEVVA